MKYQTKNIARRIATVYALLGGLYMAGQDVTGHPSADLYLRKSQPTRLEKSLMNLANSFKTDITSKFEEK